MITVNMTTILLWIWLFFSLGLLLICTWRLANDKFLYGRVSRLEQQLAKISALEDAVRRLDEKNTAESVSEIDEKCRNGFKAIRDFCTGTMDALEKEKALNTERWMTLVERLDAQGARVQELEAKVRIGFPTVPEKSEKS